MPICCECKKEFPSAIIISGKRFTLHTRKYCLECSPIGTRKKSGPKTARHSMGSDGKYDLKCSECKREFKAKRTNKRCTSCSGKERREENRTKAIEYKGSKCQLCGYNKCKWSMDFHHSDPKTKSFEIGPNWQRSWEIIKAELDKCILVCRNCHGEIHAGIAQMAELAYAQR